MSQKERVLDYIERFGSITSLEAFRDLGITRLSAVVFNLRRDGHIIVAKDETAKNRFGETIHYARYELAPASMIDEETGQWLLWQN